MDKILILGVTASGKAKLAFDLAQKLDTDIISIDSMKVYRRMNIGTAKPTSQSQKIVNYHLIDIVEPSESFSVDKFLELTASSAKQISASGKPIIASGGTAMYIKALLFGLFDGPGTDEKVRQKLREDIASKGLPELHKKLTVIDPVAAERIHQNDEKRIVRAMEVFELTGKPISSFQQQFEAEKPLDDWKIIGLRREKKLQSQRINARVKRMMEDGLVEEVKSLLAEEKPLSRQAACAIGYAEIIDHLQGNCDLDTALEKIKINTRKMAKSQRTWFKTFRSVEWIDIAQDDNPEDILQKTLELLV
ncbi:MAG: tRNA (adenosine(37)-N6)-dimethylallyltransferase MiaA [Anaerohalosphaeraceae bacterium]|nr:tRNA (adenosine(37)-N6)-dimethylallyltransferase MiaA [Anaerohalosphaeraceae bacterium]